MWLLCTAEVRTSAFSVAADSALLNAVAAVAASLVPPPGFAPPKQRSKQPRTKNGRRGTFKPAAAEKSAAVAKVTIMTAIVAFDDMNIAYTTRVEVPAAFRRRGAAPAAACVLRFGVGRLVAAARPGAKRMDVEIADVSLMYSEHVDSGLQHFPFCSFSRAIQTSDLAWNALNALRWEPRWSNIK